MKRTTWMAALLIACSLLTMAVEPEKTKELTLQETIALALKNNVNLQIQVADSEIYQFQRQFQSATYLPSFSLTVFDREFDNPASDIFSGGSDILKTGTLSGKFQVQQKTPLNGFLTLVINPVRRTTNATNTIVDPGLNAEISLSLSQPLLKSFGTLAADKEIRVATNNLESSKHLLKQTIIDLAYEVEGAYWNLVYAYQNLEAKKTSLQQSQDLLRQNEIKVKVGTAAPIEVLEAKADVANYEGQLIGAEKEIQTREEELKRLLNLSREDLVLVPSDRPQVDGVKTDLGSFLEEAIQNRPDMERAKLALKNQGIEVVYQRNQNLPDLQLTASYGATGLGGTQVDRSTNPKPPSELQTRTIWDAFSDVLKRKYTGFSVQLDLNVPLLMRQEKVQLAMAKLNLEKAELTLKNTENTVYSEVKQVLKELETNRKLVEANRISVELYEQKLRAEEKKMSVGLSTNFQVLQYLSQYSDAQNRALQSQISYKLTLARMNKVLGRTLKAFNISFSDIEPAQ